MWSFWLKVHFLYIISFKPHSNMQSEDRLFPSFQKGEMTCPGWDSKAFGPKGIHFLSLCSYQYHRLPEWGKERGVGNAWNAEEGIQHGCESICWSVPKGEDWPWRAMWIQEADCEGCILAIISVLVGFWLSDLNFVNLLLSSWNCGDNINNYHKEILWELNKNCNMLSTVSVTFLEIKKH